MKPTIVKQWVILAVVSNIILYKAIFAAFNNQQTDLNENATKATLFKSIDTKDIELLGAKTSDIKSKRNYSVNKEYSETYEPDIINYPLDILFMVDRISEVDLTGTKCLLRNLTNYFDIAYYKKVRIALMNLDGLPGVEFDFRRYRDSYGYQRGFEVLHSEDIAYNHVDKALLYAHQDLLNHSNLRGARRNIAKIVIIVLGLTLQDQAIEQVKILSNHSYLSTIVVSYGDTIQKELANLASETLSVIFVNDSKDLCDVWKKVHHHMLRQLQALYSVTLQKLDGFKLGLIGQNEAELGWSRPDDLVTSYFIKYEAVDMGENILPTEMEVAVGQETSVRLQNLDLTRYQVEITALGINSTSETTNIVFDMVCSVLVMDLIVLVDTSNLTEFDFDHLKRKFLPLFVSGFIVDITKVRIGVIFYANDVRHVVPLSTYSTRDALLRRIDQLEYERGMRNSGSALNWAFIYGFEYARRSIPKTLIVISHGAADDDVSRGAKNFRNDGTKVYFVGVGNTINLTEAKLIASEPFKKFSYFLDSYENLTSIQLNFTQQICSDVLTYYKNYGIMLPPPVQVQVSEVRNTSIEIHWQKANSLLVTGYQISDNTTSRIYSVGLNHKEFTLYNLNPGISYNISIKSQGLGKSSEAIYVATTTEVLPPYDPVVIQENLQSLQISWKIPSEDVIKHEILLLSAETEHFEQSYEIGKDNHMITPDIILPATKYRIEIRAIYKNNVKSEPATALFITELPCPEAFQVEQITKNEVKLNWHKVSLDNKDLKVSYLIKVFDINGVQVDQTSYHTDSRNKLYHGKNKDGSYFTLIRNLLPGREYYATLQAQLNGRSSSDLIVQFETPPLHLSLDIAMMIEVSPKLNLDELKMMKDFLIAFINAFQIKGDNSVRIGAVQLSNQPTSLFSMKKSTTKSMMTETFQGLKPKPGTSVLEPLVFKEAILTAFKNYRSGVPRVLILINTDQHYSNLMPQSESDLVNRGITTIIIQMSHITQSPYANQSKIHRYILNGFDKLYQSVNYVVTDASRANLFPLNRINRERALLPLNVTVIADEQGKYYAKWYRPEEIPDLYRLRLKSKSRFLWIKNITSKQLRYQELLKFKFQKNLQYTLVLESIAQDFINSKKIIQFRSNDTKVEVFQSNSSLPEKSRKIINAEKNIHSWKPIKQLDVIYSRLWNISKSNFR